MNCRRDRMRKNGERDRLSSLPDELIYKILSFISLKNVVELSVLSSRWRYMWTSMPYLDFSRDDFPSQPKFSKFITHFLTYRNHWVDLSSVKFNVSGKFSQSFVYRIINYAHSHRVQQMTMTCMLGKQIDFPLSGFEFWSLKHLTLSGSDTGHSITPVGSWDLPALTTLHLAFVTLPDTKSYLFCKCKKLKNLTLSNCILTGSDCFTIGRRRLSFFELENDKDWWSKPPVYVIGPRLKTLSIKNCDGQLEICGPDLTSLLYKSQSSLLLIADGLPSLEKVDLCISKPHDLSACKIVDLLQQFNNAKFLTLNLEIIEFLSSSVELTLHQPSPFANLTNLKIYPELLLEEACEEVTISTEVKSYLLDSSLTATFAMITREEARAVRDAKSAQDFMAELKVVLDEEKALMENHDARMREQGRAPYWREQGTQTPIHIGKRLNHVQVCWEDMDAQIQVGRVKTCRIMSILRRVEGLLTKLPTSKRDEVEARFSSLCIEANTVMNEMIDCIKIQCDMKESRIRNCFHDLPAAAQPPS